MLSSQASAGCGEVRQLVALLFSPVHRSHFRALSHTGPHVFAFTHKLLTGSIIRCLCTKIQHVGGTDCSLLNNSTVERSGRRYQAVCFLMCFVYQCRKETSLYDLVYEGLFHSFPQKHIMSFFFFLHLVKNSFHLDQMSGYCMNVYYSLLYAQYALIQACLLWRGKGPVSLSVSVSVAE